MLSIWCMIGLHDWRFRFWPSKHGFAFGDRCSRKDCGIWHKSAIRREWLTEEEMEVK